MNILRGIIKEIAVKKEVNKWFAVLTFEIDNEQINDNFNNTVNNDVIGIDLGIKTFVTFSNGKKIDCPKYFTEMSSTLSELQSEIDNLRNEIKKLSKEISELGKSEENINLLQERLELAKKNFFKKKRKYSLLYKKIVNKRAALTNTSILATNINANIENKEKEVSVLDKQEGHTIIDSEQ